MRLIDRYAGSFTGRALLSGILHYFRATLVGGENIPRRGGALLVSNHGQMKLDGAVLAALLKTELGRLPFWLGERNMWKMPGVAPMLSYLGVVPGERGRAIELLAAGELVTVFPGGVLEAYKTSAERHQLNWSGRTGFVHVAVTAGVPIVPIAATGIDDFYRVPFREPFLGRRLYGSPRYDLPIAFGRWGTPVPHRARVTVHALPPILPRIDLSRPQEVEQVRDEVMRSIQGTLDRADRSPT